MESKINIKELRRENQVYHIIVSRRSRLISCNIDLLVVEKQLASIHDKVMFYFVNDNNNIDYLNSLYEERDRLFSEIDSAYKKIKDLGPEIDHECDMD